jgi:hypothetical protein
LRHSAAFCVQRYFLNISPYFWWEIAEELGSSFLLSSDIAVSVALDATIFICFYDGVCFEEIADIGVVDIP